MAWYDKMIYDTIWLTKIRYEIWPAWQQPLQQSLTDRFTEWQVHFSIQVRVLRVDVQPSVIPTNNYLVHAVSGQVE